MSRNLRYVFPAGNATDVCLTQATSEAGNLVLNGNLANLLNGQVSFIQQGYSRQISITSNTDLSSVVFTVNGSQNGIAITEDITGPNSTTVYSTQIYDVITSISVNGAASNVTVGTGYSGFFPLIAINLETPITNYALSIQKETTDTIPTIVLTTLLKSLSSKTFLSWVVDYNFLILKNSTSSDNDQYLLSNTVIPFQYGLIYIVGEVSTIKNSISLNFTQV